MSVQSVIGKHATPIAKEKRISKALLIEKNNKKKKKQRQKWKMIKNKGEDQSYMSIENKAEN